MNKVAYEGLGSPAAVKLMYEENRRVIGLKPGDPQHTNSFPVKQKGKHNLRTVHMSPFCRNFGFDIRRTVLFHAIEIDREGMMRLELNKTVIIGKAGK
ncbi:MAG: hypothetical protein IPL32_05065 [Chloracidobacterium sp.]|nr:hypothetical protein [Chloracidobacterium sp.]